MMTNITNNLNIYLKYNTLGAFTSIPKFLLISMVHFDAVIFDLDGVITKTALVHGAAWKKMFDAYLRSREDRFNEPFREFTHADDYLPYVDGKPRYKGVASFLESRGIEIPYGDPSDDPSEETICGLGNRKNVLFNEVLETEGVQVYDTTLTLIKSLKKNRVRVGVASSSKNCKPVLERAGILELFETRIDGVVSAELGLHGKPEPDIFTTACDRLGVSYHRSVVVEDAVSGVQAGRNGNFGFVLGVAREDNIQELQSNGADVVVEDLGSISMATMNEWFQAGLKEDQWMLKYFDYDQDKERPREALLAIGNGYFGTRGALEESEANMVNYPGTYVSGLFNRRVSVVADRDIENEDLVNVINWLPITFKIGAGPWFAFEPAPNFDVRSIQRTLDFRTGELVRLLLVEDHQGRMTSIESRRFASMEHPHKAAISYRITPVNYSETLTIRSEMRGDHINAGVERYKQLDQHHLVPIDQKIHEGVCLLEVQTNQSEISIAAASRNLITAPEGMDFTASDHSGEGWVAQEFHFRAASGQEIRLDKMVSLHTTLDENTRVRENALNTVRGMKGYSDELNRSTSIWSAIWNRMDVIIHGDRSAQKLARLHVYHMMVTASPHHAQLDFGIPPRGLHGEAYRGHIFWDELYILPLYNIHYPEVTRSALMYRYRRLDQARAYARQHGYQGAMFPWQSGSDGREETQVVHLNPLSGEWGEDYSSLQRHVSLAIAFNTWNYYWTTNDLPFMSDYGAELLFDISRFWASKCRYEKDTDRYHIDKVMGPDEFHEKLPGSEEGGLTDNAYTNIMVSWMFEKAEVIYQQLSPSERDAVLQKLQMKREEMDQWKSIGNKLALHISETGIIEQFKGYFDLEELDWDDYKSKYQDIHRMDRILKAEGKSPDDFKLSKQADLLMSFFNLGEKQVTSIIRKLGYDPPEDYYRKNYEYYIRRTSHGSTLSRLVHGHIAYKLGKSTEGWELYDEALRSDLIDIQGGTTGEGIHCGVMAGTVYFIMSVFSGMDLGEVPLELCPHLPGHWSGLEFNFTFRGRTYHVTIDRDTFKISTEMPLEEKIKIHICGRKYVFSDSGELSIKHN
jgi:beta-phosphoglucomutase family hydrolase